MKYFVRPICRSFPIRTLLLLTVVCLAVNSVESAGLVADVGKAFDRLANLSKPFALVPGIRVEKRPVSSSVVQIDARPSASASSNVLDSAERVFEDHDLVLDAAPGLQMRVTAENDGRGFRLLAQPNPRPEPRTFGVMRRLKLVLLPIMYKLGVITTLLTLLTVFALKGLTIGVLLLIMGSVGFASKFKYHHPEGFGGAHKDIHVHVHGGGGGVTHSYASPYYHDSSWERTGVPAEHSSHFGAHPSPHQPSKWNGNHFNIPQTTPSPWDQFIS